MAQAKSLGLRETLTRLLPKSGLERLAGQSGMVQLCRKVDPAAKLWTLALGFGTGCERRLAGLRRMYQPATGTSLVPSAFYDGFTPELMRHLRAVVRGLCGQLSEHEPQRSGLLGQFADVVAADAAVFKLHRLLAGRYPGARTNSSPLPAKLHLVTSVTGRGVERAKLTGERASNHRTLRMGPWVRDRLLVFDLGYFRYQLFDCIDRNGGYFVSRLPASANPKIVGVDRRGRGRGIELKGT